MTESLPDSFDTRQPDLPTLAVDPDPEVTEDGQVGRKYPADLTQDGPDDDDAPASGKDT
ncbi:chromosome partitioning protein [Actinotalea ferrariae CF5-4]|uniref:Chromosome partitioning protein n=1 Tax=Actinotalea ferrariae CF5-4 TaxID=948458 RepID=A0A021VUT6_9CELL|nr:chromosome partitioning protein [Actinotalea ferrariae]EYR64911.1 chromosome partitioning protein [Actinotalea ferrariae CF5-4]